MNGVPESLAETAAWERLKAPVSEEPARHEDPAVQALVEGARWLGCPVDVPFFERVARLVRAADIASPSYIGDTAYARGISEGRRQATEGWGREWGVDLHGRGAQCVLDEHAAWGIVAGCPDDLDPKVFVRLVGPWEPAEQPEGGQP